MTQERTFTLDLKNGQQIVLKFSSISATGDRLWQMFATTEALDTVDHIISVVPSDDKPTVAKTKLPEKSTVATKAKPAAKTAKKK
jgi:hypothetical protein